jgi:hypothetical protein
MTKRSILSTILISFALAACTDVGGEGADNGGSSNGNGHGDGDGNGNGDGDGNGNGGGTGGAGPADVAAMISGVECEQAHQCKSSFPADSGASFAEIYGNTVDECYPLNDQYWGVEAVEAAVAGGTIEFDQAAADECIEGSVSAPVCSTFFEQGPGVPEACWGAFAGTVANGGACEIDFECSAGYCESGTCTAGE